ncbi:hypothetical protein A3J17_00880 [Candidatus Curtissbacteria bacterium RIFCSPLOWO2_02_FULL_40_11]|uniref:Uncharacterized protein n=1 Tax=Candidatus Curtissbacteria bacterium RIFCSPLOWO2_12_FULL_38_9 TaxID=1797735 RepID=A0A1F5ICG3_9BACT|nr:MAG: hypothetical protein A3J17_00880 [Candidatus Curtissbacteria bacterium RIFCSPLOWO2_02_FULL_40_11]OGE13979.1 MAG: hypothetical protein A3G14_03870 [Candidatus Curtissbacteria bacterium RIFCSPLOWO2_12_FULL_38_9]
MERITERRQTAADGLSEPTLLSIRTSISQGGIMLKVLPLARQGLTVSEIEQITGIRHDLVASSLFRQRVKGRLPESARQFNKRLIEAIVNLPEDPELRKGLLDQVSFGLYRGNLKSFTTPRACLRLAGLGRLIGNYNWAQAVVPVLRSAEIAIKEFFLNVNDDGVEVERTYRIMFKAEQKKAISTLKNRVDELDHRGIPFI